MNNSNIFAWDGYEDDPKKMIGVDTIPTQKNATYNKSAKGTFVGNALESFFTNNDEYAYPQIGSVIGENPMALVYGKGFVEEGILIPTDYDIIDSIADIPTGEEAKTVKIAITGDEVANAMTSNTVYKDIILTEANVDKDVKLYATEEIVIDSIGVSGTKGASNGKIIYGAKNVTIKNVTPDANATLYNMFEGSSSMPLETMNVSNITIDNPKITHNIVNVYAPAEDCVITIKDCKFNLNVNNSNAMRMANYLNAKNVTVNFENVEWNYEAGSPAGADWSYAGLVLYQPASTDHALSGNYDELKTWKMNFKDCKYNGEKVTSNNFGAHNQVVYFYGLNGQNTVVDPETIDGFTLTFA